MHLLEKCRTQFIIEGILFIILGILAIAMPGIMTFGVSLFVGWFLLIGGIIHAYHTIKATKDTPGFWASLIAAIVSIAAGALILFNPLKGVLTLTILLMAFFFAEGVAKVIYGLQLKPLRGWGWLVASGLVAIAMGALLWSGWPGIALWAIGLLVGINMLFFGISLLALACSVKRTKV